MAVKTLELPEVGTVKLYRRRGTRGIRLTLSVDNYTRVTMPLWMPYSTALGFVESKKDWIIKHQSPSHVFKENELVGKSYRIKFVPTGSSNVSTRIVGNELRVFCPPNVSKSSVSVQSAAERVALKSLKQQSQQLLPQRLDQLAKKHGFNYAALSVKRLKSRWGSCTHQKDIALNIFLMQLPWDLIDYVITHELVHTKALNHGRDFWVLLEECLPDARDRKKMLRTHKPAF